MLPLQRRLRHLSNVTIRNLAIDTNSAIVPDVFFTVSHGEFRRMKRRANRPGFAFEQHHILRFISNPQHLAGSGVPVYQSEIVQHNVNPNWLPIEWSTQTRIGNAAAQDALLETSTVRLQVFTRSASTAGSVGGDSPCPLPSTSYFPASFTIYPVTDALVLDRVLDLRELKFLGFDIFQVLSSISRTGSASSSSKQRTAAERSGGGDPSDADALALIPEAAGFHFDALPLNTVVFTMDDGQYVTSDIYKVLKPDSFSSSSTSSSTTAGSTTSSSSASDVQPPSTPSRSLQPSSSTVAAPSAPVAGSAAQPSSSSFAKHDLRRGFDAINRLMQLQRDTSAAEEATQSALQQVANELSNPAITAETQAKQGLLQQARRVHALRKLRDSMVSEAENAEQEIIVEKAKLAHAAACVKDAASKMQDVSRLIEPMGQQITSKKDELSVLRTLVTAKQLSLLAELRGLYPIQEQEKGKRYAIRGIVLPSEREFGSAPEEQVSTALGYTCHLVALSSKYLQVPLRYLPQHMASRSAIRDEVLAHTREWPLSWKAADRDAIRVGFRMLQRDVKQLLHSQGIQYAEGSHILSNMRKLFVVLLDVPLPDAA